MTSSVLKHQHTSLQFSDTKEQQLHDAHAVFAKGKAFPIKTGTESAGETHLHDGLIAAAKEFGHAIHFSRGNWVAVDKSIVKPGTLKKGEVFVVSNDTLVGHQHDRTFPWVRFTHADERLGRISVAGFHYSTKGRETWDPNNDTNKMYARKIAEWMRDSARGTAIALGAGDFNMIDTLERQDWAFGGPFTSMADELGAHQNTGHGPIDGFVSFDKDGRVKPKKFQVLRDDELKLYSDHFVCRGTWTIRHLKTS
jgi:hypothetical protein